MSLLSSPPVVVAAGVDVFSAALRDQGADVHDVYWRPPGFGDPADLATLAALGGSPGLRRRLAAGQALVVAGLGSLLGFLVGLGPGVAFALAFTCSGRRNCTSALETRRRRGGFGGS